jgi:hypothetical protein
MLNHASMLAVTEPTNYTRLSKKIIHRADDLANLSPYNPVVHEIMMDFKPTYIPAKIIISSAVTITSYIKVCVTNTSEFKHSYYKPVLNENSESISFKSHTHTEFKIQCQFRIIFHQKHQTRCSEWPLPMVLSFSHCRIKGSWYSSRNTSAHLQQVGTKPWVREGTQLDLPDRTKIKDTKESWQAFWWGSWLICKKAFLAFEESFQKLCIKLILY